MTDAIVIIIVIIMQERRYLVYDLMAINGAPVVDLPFSDRWNLIEREVRPPILLLLSSSSSLLLLWRQWTDAIDRSID